MFDTGLPDPSTGYKHALAGLSYPASKAQIIAHVKNAPAPKGIPTQRWNTNKLAESIGKRISDTHNYNSTDEVIGDMTKYQ